VRSVEATGETVGEAKWLALRELEKLEPGLDKSSVRFEILSEGERGLLGVGYAPARVLAMVETEAGVAAAPATPPQPVAEDSDAAALVRELVEAVNSALGLGARVEIADDGEEIRATCVGDDLGLLIGKHGQTIDAVQYLANAAVARALAARPMVVVDAAGYRERRRATLEAIAVRSAEQALSSGRQVELEPMSSPERRLVHERLKLVDGVETRSEGTEPNRYVIVLPIGV
jgi:spoIIIJ-associated protein